MRELDPAALTRLERNILETLYRVGEAPASEVAADLKGDATEDSVRVTLGKLERKGVVTHRREGVRHIYRPAIPRDRARVPAIRHLLDTYFAGSSSRAVLTLLDASSEDLSDEDLDELQAWIDRERGDDG